MSIKEQCFENIGIIEGAGNNYQEEYFDVLANQKLTFRDIADHLTGPVISIVVHIILIAFLSSIVVFEPAEKINEVEVEMVEMEIKSIEEPPLPPEPQEDVVSEEVEVKIERPEMSSMEEAEPPTADIDVTEAELSVDLSGLEGAILGNNSALSMNLGMRTTNFLAKRSTGGNAPAKLKSTIAKGLEWLATKQNDDGSFRFGTHRNAQWGACTLAFLGSGNSTTSGMHQQVVKDSIDKMIAEQRNGRIGMHAHAAPFVTLALLDACALEPKDMKLRQVAQQFLNYALRTQQANGCWSGGAHPSKKECTDVDISATGWWAMALVSGRLAGLEVPEERLDALKQTLLSIAKRTFKGEVIASTHGGQSKSFVADVTTDSTLLTLLQFLGVNRETPIIQELAGRLHSSRKDFSKLNYWTMYQQGIGVFQLGQTNAYWFGYVEDVITKLVESQNDDGSWSCEDAFALRGKSPQGGTLGYWGDEGMTAMAVLTLQVYFRYGDVHEMYKRHGRLIQQKSKKSSKKSVAKAVKSDVEDLGIVF